MNKSEAEELHGFWFGIRSLDDPDYLKARMAVWFGKAPEFDNQIKNTFASWLGVEAPNESQLLGEILLHDQIPRNAFRGHAKMFAYDSLALSLTLKAVAVNLHKALHPVEAGFLLMPLEHSENLEHQNLNVKLMEEASDRAHSAIKATTQRTVEYAHKHREVIRRFGRFPHRNVILGRTSTPDELEFLKQPGSRF